MSTVASPAHPSEHRLRAIAFRIGGVMVLSAMVVIAKLAGERGAHPLEIMFYRSLFALPPIVVWVMFGPGMKSVYTSRPIAHATRTALGLTAMLFAFQALILLPLAESVTISFVAPVFATILSAIILSEKVGPHRWVAVAAGFLGVLIVMQPGGSTLPPAGLAVAVLAAACVAGVTITLRQIGSTEPATTTVFWFTMIAVPVTGLAMPFVGKGHDLITWLLLMAMGVSGVAGQLLLTTSLRHAPVAVLAPFDYLQLPIALLSGWLIWRHAPEWSTVAGGALIIASSLYMAIREHRRRGQITATTPVV